MLSFVILKGFAYCIQERILVALEDAGVFKTGDLVKEKVNIYHQLTLSLINKLNGSLIS